MATGSTDEVPEGCCIIISDICQELRDFAVEPWLECFLGFVSDLEDCLHNYASVLRVAEEHAAANTLGDVDSDLCAPLWGLLSTLCVSYEAGQVSDVDYKWYCLQARLAITEFQASSTPGMPHPLPSLTDAFTVVPSQAPSVPSSVIDLSLPALMCPLPRIICLPNAEAGNALAAVVCSSSLKHMHTSVEVASHSRAEWHV